MNILSKGYYHFLGWFRSFWYGYPSKKIFVLGVTGTKGKSLTLELINEVLKASGKKTALLSSVNEIIGDVRSSNNSNNTMPGRGYIQKFLSKAIDAGAKYALIEVTSQGVVNARHKYIDWDAALCINLHPEHIESHGSFENYKEAKLDFFRYVAESPKKNKMFFVNKSDPYAEEFVRAAKDNKCYFFSGDFLKANYAAAEAVGRALGIDEKTIEKALSSFKGMPGRMEVVEEAPFKVVIDYAHTPDSLEEVYKALKLELQIAKSKGRLITILGSAGGGRDKWKRPKMGDLAAQYGDIVFVTNEDPMGEDPMTIINEIASSKLQSKKDVFKILDRQEAINKAIALATAKDIVVLTGKGSETGIRVTARSRFSKGKVMPWSEREAVLLALKQSGKI